MLQRTNKGTAGMGGRGKNIAKSERGTVTGNRKRKTGGGKTLARPSTPRANQKRNQTEWAKRREMANRY